MVMSMYNSKYDVFLHMWNVVKYMYQNMFALKASYIKPNCL